MDPSGALKACAQKWNAFFSTLISLAKESHMDEHGISGAGSYNSPMWKTPLRKIP